MRDRADCGAGTGRGGARTSSVGAVDQRVRRVHEEDHVRHEHKRPFARPAARPDGVHDGGQERRRRPVEVCAEHRRGGGDRHGGRLGHELVGAGLRDLCHENRFSIRGLLGLALQLVGLRLRDGQLASGGIHVRLRLVELALHLIHGGPDGAQLPAHPTRRGGRRQSHRDRLDTCGGTAQRGSS